MSSFDWRAWEEKNNRALTIYIPFSYFDPRPENWCRKWQQLIERWSKYTDYEKKNIYKNRATIAEIFDTWLLGLLTKIDKF